MKTSVILIILGFVSSTNLFAQVSGNVNYDYHSRSFDDKVAISETSDNAITLSVRGVMNVLADKFVAAFNITQVAPTARAADSLTNQRVDTFRSGLHVAGIPDSAIHLDIISLVPKYDFNIINRIFSKTYNEIPDGFEMQSQMMITFNDIDKLKRIMTTAASAEIYDLIKVDYFVLEPEKAIAVLKNRCLENLQQKIETLKSMDIRTDTLTKIFDEDFKSVMPVNRYTTYNAAARPSFHAIKKAETATSSKIRQIETSPTIFYKPLSYETFNVIINPVVAEPVIQLTYHATIKFLTKSKLVKMQHSATLPAFYEIN